MSDSTSVSQDNMAQLFGDTITEVNRIDTNFTRLISALEKRGLQVGVDIDEPLRMIRQYLIRAQRETENVIGQLNQLQDLVRSSALVTSSLHLDQVLEQVMESVI